MTESSSALGRLGAAEAAAALRDALGDRVPGVRTAAAFALGQLRDDNAAQALLRQARSDLFEPAQAAAEALAHVDRTLLVESAALTGAGPHLLEAVDLALL
ncbi:MAG: HEAT repeat domain-containing protein [Solirubrobacteraceae bacterium]